MLQSFPSCLTLCEPMACSLLAPLATSSPSQEYWSGLPLCSSGALTQGFGSVTSPVSSASQSRLFSTELRGEARIGIQNELRREHKVRTEVNLKVKYILRLVGCFLLMDRPLPQSNISLIALESYGSER